MYYLDELHELNKTASAWAFDAEQLQANPSPVVGAGLREFLIACIVELNHYGTPTARDIVESETAFCCSGLWLMEKYEITKGKYKGYYIKGAKVTKNEVLLLELWNGAEEVKTLRG